MSVPPDPAPPYSGYTPYTPRPTIRFDAIGDGMRYFQAEMGTWIVSALIYLIVTLGITFFYFGSIIAQVFAAMQAGKQPKNLETSLVADLVFAIVFAAASGFLTGGMYKMAAAQIRGERISPGMLFSAGDVFPSLFVLALFYDLPSLVTQRLPLGGLLTLIGAFVAGGLFLLGFPLVADKRMNTVEAMSASC